MEQIRALKYQRMKLRKKLFEVDSTLKKKRADLAADESDLEEEWIIKHEENLVAKERERVKNKFAKENEKRKAENEDPLPESHLEAKLKLVDEMEQRLKKERKTGRVDPGNATAEKLLASIAKIDQRITATKIQATDKEENKEIALTTSKTNYIDPRISFAWCKKYDVPVEKVFNKTLLEKFRWASNVDANWVSVGETVRSGKKHKVIDLLTFYAEILNVKKKGKLHTENTSFHFVFALPFRFCFVFLYSSIK